VNLSAIAPTSTASTADFAVQVRNAGTMLEALRIKSDGKVGIGTNAPATSLNVITGSNTNSLQIRRNSDTVGDISIIGFRIATTNNEANFAEIRAVRTNRAVSSDTDLRFMTRSNDTLTERFRVRDDGLVGINETFAGVTPPNGQLVVKSGSTTRVPLIVDTLASHTGLLQAWRVDGGTFAYVTNGGRFASKDGIQNNISPNNSYVITGTAGTTIYRDVNDSNPALAVNQQNASSTGDIVQFRRAGTTQATIARDGIANFTGTPSNEQTGDYTLVLADKGKVLRVNSSSNRTITIPLNSSVAFPIDTEIAIIRYGSGTVSISPTSGVTLNSVASNRKVKDQYGSCALKKIGTDEWVLVGSLEA
jgi:hypothetical protein